MKRPRCPVTRKLMFSDWDKAVHAAVESSRKRKVGLRVYPCPDCGCFHLTKRPANPQPPTVPGPFTPADLARLLTRRQETHV